MSTTPRLEIGRTSNFQGAFAQIVLLMASLPVYGTLPVKRLRELAAILQRGDYLLATDAAGQLQGALLWRGVRDDIVETLIKEERLPKAAELDTNGKAKVLVGMLGTENRALLQLGQKFRRQQRGNHLFFERHLESSKPGSGRFGWVDTSGKLCHGKAAAGEQKDAVPEIEASPLIDSMNANSNQGG